MVATLLRLRFRVLGNDLKRNPWQLVGFIVGALYGVGVLFAAVVGLVVLGITQNLELARTLIVGIGSLVTLGWILGPLVAFGVDQTLDPQKLAVFPISQRRLMVALTLAGIVGIPGMITSAAAIATVATWAHWPLAVVAGVVSIPLTIVTAVVASRTVATLASGLGAGRRFREVSGVLVFIPLILAGPIVAGIATGFAFNVDAVQTIVQVMSWTPLGAAWAIPADVAAGFWLPAAAKLAIGLATLALLWLLWRWSLADSVTRPATTSTTKARAGHLGWFGRVPASPTGGVFARSLTFWFRDPRYQRQLIVVPLVPVLLWFYVRNGDAALGLSFTAPIIAFAIGIALYTDISMDGTAFASEVATGVRGRADRLGRTLAAAVFALPIIVVAAVLPFVFSGRWEAFPAVFGMSIGVLFSCYAVCAISSAQFVMPVAGSGDNPFKRVPGTTMIQGLIFLGIWGIALVLSAPTVVTGIIAVLTGNLVLSLVSCGLGVVLGTVFLTIGIRIGGGILDRTAPVLLSRMKAMKNA